MLLLSYSDNVVCHLTNMNFRLMVRDIKGHYFIVVFQGLLIGMINTLQSILLSSTDRCGQFSLERRLHSL